MNEWGTAALCIVVIGACGLCACGGSAKPEPQPQPQVIHGDFYVEADDPPPGTTEPASSGDTEKPAAEKPVKRNQPPQVKLALGHYSNSKRGIGAVIDCTQKEAKIRYDGTDEIIKLYAQPGSSGRTDFHKNASTVLMHVYDDGSIVVYIPNVPTARDGIALSRDADADPL